MNTTRPKHRATAESKEDGMIGLLLLFAAVLRYRKIDEDNFSDEVGTVYLLHFDRPYKHAEHYLGWTTDLASRIESHRQGTGARLMEVVKNAGIGFTVARTWEGTRLLERKIKNRGGLSRECPMCKALADARDAERSR